MHNHVIMCVRAALRGSINHTSSCLWGRGVVVVGEAIYFHAEKLM